MRIGASMTWPRGLKDEIVAETLLTIGLKGKFGKD